MFPKSGFILREEYFSSLPFFLRLLNHIISILNEKKPQNVNEKGIIIFSAFKTTQEIDTYIQSIEQTYRLQYKQPVVIVIPNHKRDPDQTSSTFEFKTTPFTTQLWLQERSDQLRICTTSCADGIGIFNPKTNQLEEGYKGSGK